MMEFFINAVGKIYVFFGIALIVIPCFFGIVLIGIPCWVLMVKYAEWVLEKFEL